MKKFATIAGSVALMMAAVLPALAVGNNCSNGTTGPFSTNSCTVKNTSNVTVNNINDAQITNNVTARSNSGNNTASNNTLGGAVSTGNATLNATVSNAANINTTTVSGGPAASGNSGSNNITGPGNPFDNPANIDNQVWIENLHQVAVENNNAAVVGNTVNVTANTGENGADNNTGPASISTGNARLGLSLGNHVNDSATGVSAGAGGTGGNSGDNSTTGPFSTNSVTVNNTTDVAVNNINDLIVGNWVDALANSGRNTASNNTLGGSVEAGNAGANVGVSTEGNINTTTVNMAMGGFANDGSNGVTGPESVNRVELLNSQGIVVDNKNNKCESQIGDLVPGKDCVPSDLGVFNYDNDEANTGDNGADNNTFGGSVASGLADLVKTLLTHLNDSLTVVQQ